MSWSVRAATAALLLVPATVGAEPTRNIALTVFDPTPATSGSSFQVQNADVGGNGEYVASAFASYAANPLVLGTDEMTTILIRHHTKLSLGGAYAFGDRYEAGARMPLYMQSGDGIVDGTTSVPAASGAATGDLTLHAKAQLWRDDRLRLGAALALTIPTATDSEFTGSDLPTGRVVGLVSYTPIRFLTVHANAGGLVRKTAQFANVEQGSGLTWAVGVSARAFERVFFDVEAFGDAIPGGTLGRPTTTNPMGTPSMLNTFEALAGGHMLLTPQISIGVAAGRGLSSGIGTPDLRGVVTFAYAPSARPLPPLHRPRPVEPVDLTQEDTDYDRFNDAVDKCPKEAEDKDGFKDDDGCPEPDNDEDGVLDAADKCAAVAEDNDKFEDSDGCPELDNDRDGVADAKDKCPDKAEKINGKDDNDGCPDTGDSLVISNPDRLELLESVSFTGTDVAKASGNVLNQLAATLRARADISRLRITVHVNPSKPDRKDPAKSTKRDQVLSDKRAAAVKAWLVELGVAADRIDAKGFGSTKPLVPSTQRGADEINDRVELIILERN